MEDSLMKQKKQIGNKSKISQEEGRISKGNLTELNHDDLEKDGLEDKICRELEIEEFERIEDCILTAV